MEETDTTILELSSHRTDCSLTLFQRKLQMSPVQALRSEQKLQHQNSGQLAFPTDMEPFCPSHNYVSELAIPTELPPHISVHGGSLVHCVS